MLVYCVSDQAKPNGDHEVHNIGCSYPLVLGSSLALKHRMKIGLT